MNAFRGAHSLRVYPAESLAGSIEVPGDKSISHRTAMFAALADGKSRIRGFLQSGDCIATLRAVETLGAEVEMIAADEILVTGTSGRFKSPDVPLDMGNSGTGMRLLTGLLSGFPVHARLEGDRSLSSRPMNRIAKPLGMMGAEIRLLGGAGRPPIEVHGGDLAAIEYELPMASAQVKSAVLLAGACARGTTVVQELRPTRDHSERIMAALGLPITIDGLRISIEGSAGAALDIPAGERFVPGDFSSAAFWMLAAMGAGEAGVSIEGVGLNPRRTAFMDVLQRMGAKIEIDRHAGDEAGEPYGDMRIAGGSLNGTRVAGNEIPNLIDECPLVAVAGALAEGTSEIAGAAELRVKESDRIAVMCANLRRCGIEVEEREDGMLVEGARGGVAGGVAVDSRGDHRIAMAMAVLALFAREPIVIRDVACVQTSYPQFWKDLESLGGKVEEVNEDE